MITDGPSKDLAKMDLAINNSALSTLDVTESQSCIREVLAFEYIVQPSSAPPPVRSGKLSC